MGERMQRTIADFWVSPEKTPGGKLKVYPCMEKGPVDFMVANPMIFGLSPDDLALWAEPVRTKWQLEEKVGAFLDRMFHMGWLWVHFDSHSLPNPRIQIKFDVETGQLGAHRMHTIAQYLVDQGIPETEMIWLRAQERQGPEGTGWATSSGAIIKGHLFWNNPDKPPCPHCGAQISKDELLDTLTCPKCGKVIA